MSPDLIKRCNNALEYLLNGTGDRDGGPYVTVTPEALEERNKAAREVDGDVSHDIPLRIADDCEFVTVHGFEGQPCFGTAEAIEDAGRLIFDLRAALQECETERHNYMLAHRCAEEARSKLDVLINTPETADFIKAVQTEAAHQRVRWPSEKDAGKTDADWFWLLGYLAGKAMHNLASGNTEKGLHHIITTAAACANWHHARTVGNSMRPGVGAEST